VAFTTTSATATNTNGLSSLDVLSTGSASQALDTIDTALDAVNSARGNLGALQSRFESAISNIQVTAESVSAARGRIVDADFAAETANLSRAQILQQAGTAMVAQANQLPQQVLSLLR
jgi:flagellin